MFKYSGLQGGLGVFRGNGGGYRRKINLDGLREYQKVGAEWLRDRIDQGKSALLADEMGLGKTAQILRAIDSRQSSFVVCPLSLVKNWHREIRLWRPDLRVPSTFEDLQYSGTIFVAHYEMLPKVKGRMNRLIAQDLSKTVLVVDEVHRSRKMTSNVMKSISLLSQQVFCAVGATGTPMVGDPSDLHGVLSSLRLFRESFGTNENFRRCFGAYDEVIRVKDGGQKTVTKWGKVLSEEVEERLKKVMLRRRIDDHIDLPPVIEKEVECSISKRFEDMLDREERKWEGFDSGKLPPFEMFSAATRVLAEAKIEPAIDLVSEVSRDRPTLVFTAHEEVAKEIARRTSGHYLTGDVCAEEREMKLSQFKNGKVRVLSATMRTGGVGLNIPEAGYVVIVDEEFTPDFTDQAIHRARRHGQQHENVIVFKMTSTNSLDERIRAILSFKRKLISESIG